MARIIDLTTTAIAAENSVVVVTDLESSKKITISDLRNTLVKNASTTVSGTVKVGTGLRIDESGVLSTVNFSGYSLPPATTSTLGGVIVGSGLTVNSQGVISLNIPPSPRASTAEYGVVRIGSGLNVLNGVISNAITLPPSFLVEGGQTINENFTTENNKEFYSIAPITLDRNITFTISSNSTWILYKPSAAQYDEEKISYFQEGNRLILTDLTIEDNKELYSLDTVTISNNATLTVERNSTWILYDVVRLDDPADRQKISYFQEGNRLILTDLTIENNKEIYSLAPITIGNNATLTVERNSTWTLYDVVNFSQATIPSAIQESPTMIDSNYAITNNRNATSYGPITINRNVTVEIPPLSTWIIF